MSTAFSNRHIGCTPSQRSQMLAAIGLPDERALIADVLPEVIREDEPLALPPALSESELESRLRELAAKNTVLTSMIGMGYHGTVTPPVIRRNVLESPAWYTAYTPYQPEISQGRLEALLNFQTLVEDLAGLPTANASLLDEATAAAEAMALARRVDRSGAGAFLIDSDLHPQVRAVLQTRAEASGVQLIDADLTGTWPDEAVFGVLVQTPGTTGRLHDVAVVAARAHERGALCVVSADPLAMVLLRAPGESGADIVVGSLQRFGVPMGFGGPHAAFMAVRSGLERQLPGRLVGVSVDADGRGAYRLALQTREQHIRRDKATSNICTAQVLLAVVAAMYAVYHGADGLRSIAWHAADSARRLAAALRSGGLSLRHEEFFDTVVVEVPGAARTVVEAARVRGVNLRLLDEDAVGVSTDETTTEAQLQAVCAAFGVPDSLPAASDLTPTLPAQLLRTGPLLTHPVFSSYRTETEMLRYLRRLSDRDLALDRTMIPLGSCTMKLNATAEMEPISWSEFANLHPYAPAEQAAGTLQLIEELEQMLAEVTGYSAVSVQPNAGSQGEFAGLLAIRAYHRDRGEPQREVCLIPSSAHGTNAASAVMAGMEVSVVACDADGDVDVADLKDKISATGERLAALMITYPSTHGVFEEHIAEICAMVHDAGGQVYVDGANLNALVGLARPGRFGADVSHLNLHKTFCIPHGGGGPGVGPVAVADHLVAYLPSHPLAGKGGVGPVAAAPFGSALVLPISWAYLRLMGPQGLREATIAAILSANYIATRLKAHYPVLYSGRDGLVAHECIVDLRDITKQTGVTVEDVAKRLIDYGFHAPTMAFPVAGTLMIEPTESESLAEMDRFCDAMIAIRGEIAQVADGSLDRDDNPLKRAPHPAAAVLGWDRAYPVELGVFPVGSQDKYFPPVSRIDSAFGDRNLVCACPPVEAFAHSSRGGGAPRCDLRPLGLRTMTAVRPSSRRAER